MQCQQEMMRRRVSAPCPRPSVPLAACHHCVSQSIIHRVGQSFSVVWTFASAKVLTMIVPVCACYGPTSLHYCNVTEAAGTSAFFARGCLSFHVAMQDESAILHSSVYNAAISRRLRHLRRLQTLQARRKASFSAAAIAASAPSTDTA